MRIKRMVFALSGCVLTCAFLGCANAAGAGASASGYTASALASAMDGKSTAWVTDELAVEEKSGVSPNPTLTLEYAADAGDAGVGDGAARLTYSGETGSTMELEVFARITPRSLPTSGKQAISIKIKPVVGCVKKAIAFVGESTSASSGWHQTEQAVDLAADAWTTVSVTVDPSTFVAGLWRVGVKLIGDGSDTSQQFASSGTVYIDDFSALDYRKNEFSSEKQLIDASYADSDDHSGFVESWEVNASTAGDGYLVDTITFPADTSAGWGTWAGVDFSTKIYKTTSLVDLSKSTLTFKIYVYQALIDFLALQHTGTWLGIYDNSNNSVRICYNVLSPPVVGWNTISVNFADPRLQSTDYADKIFDYTKVSGFNIEFATMNTTEVPGSSINFKLDYVDIVPN